MVHPTSRRPAEPTAPGRRRERDRRLLAWTLAAVAGFVDCVGFLLIFGIFTSHMSGNTAAAAAELGAGDRFDVLQRVAMVPVFLLSVGLAYALVELLLRQGRRRVTAVALTIEAALLLGFVVAGQTLGDGPAFTVNSWRAILIGALAAAAMGTQDAVLRRVGDVNVHTTFITGVYMSTAVETVRWLSTHTGGRRRPPDPGRHRRRAAAGAALRVFIPVLVLFVVGGIIGGYCAVRIGFAAGLVPLAAVLAAVAAAASSPTLEPIGE